MARPFDPAALRRLNAPLRAGRGLTQPTSARIGYQPGLDGLRAVAVLVVIAYHLKTLGSGPEWIRGGFVGIEVFFVVSGYLITAQLLEEWERDGRLAAGTFVLRRLRRQFPLVLLMFVGVGASAALWRRDTLPRLRSDALPGLLSLSNWRQVFDHVGHFATLDAPPLLGHLWPIAVEAQWYIVWPLLVIALLGWARGEVSQARIAVLALAVLSALTAPLVYREFETFRIDLAYLATFTRVAGLLLGSFLATLWTPWRWHGAGRRRLPLLDAAGFLALIGLAALVVRLRGTAPGPYQLRLFLVSGPRILPGGLFGAAILGTIAVAAAVHPGATLFHRVFTFRPLAELGRRSFCLYLWHWPIFVLLRADDGAVRLVLALLLSAAVTEATFRFVEGPLRDGFVGAWIASWRQSSGTARRDYTVSSVLYGVAAVSLVGAVAVRLAGVDSHDLTIDTSTAEFDATAVLRSVDPPPNTVAAAPSTTSPKLPRRLLVVGDTQAHSLVVNRPSGIEGTFVITDGSNPDCGVFDRGTLVTERRGVHHEFDQCAGWERTWAAAARSSNAEVTLVVLGAWDVFDVRSDGETVPFGSAELDRRFLAKLDLGIAALKSSGSKVALLEIPCLRPVDVEAADAPGLPERGDDDRVAHLNDLLRRAAADDPAFVSFVKGPVEWCTNPTIASDPAYRWNGVDFYKLGAKLQFETIAAPLVRIPV